MPIRYDLVIEDFDVENDTAHIYVDDIVKEDETEAVLKIFESWWNENVSPVSRIERSPDTNGRMLINVSDDGLNRVADGFTNAKLDMNGKPVYIHY